MDLGREGQRCVSLARRGSLSSGRLCLPLGCWVWCVLGSQ